MFSCYHFPNESFLIDYLQGKANGAINASSIFLLRRSKSSTGYCLSWTIASLSKVSLSGILITSLTPCTKFLYQALVCKMRVTILLLRYFLSQISHLVQIRKMMQFYIIKAYPIFLYFGSRLLFKSLIFKTRLIEHC